MPQFILDHTTFTFSTELASAVGEHIETFIDFLDQLKVNGHRLLKTEDAYYTEVLPGMDLVTALYNPDLSPLDNVQRQAFLAHFNRISDIGVSDIVQHVRGLVANRIAVAMISVHINSSKIGEIHGAKRVDDDRSLLAFYRAVFKIEDTAPEDFHDLAELAFPAIFLVREGTRFNRFNHPYSDTRRLVVEHLAAINDHFHRVRNDCANIPDRIIRQFAAECQVDLSPESPNTRQNQRAMRQRTVFITETEYQCEWHTKLFPTVDRIHFDPGANLEIQGRILVGIFVDHLDT